MKTRAIMKKSLDELLIALALVLVILICSIPFKQEVQVTKIDEYTSTDEYQIEVGFGGPEVTWIQVICNRTAEIRFLHQIGVWTSTESFLMASYISTIASYNVRSEHSTYIVEVYSDGPIAVQIVYTYLMKMETTILNRVLNPIVQRP